MENTKLKDIRIYILPGDQGRRDAHFYLWLQKELRKKGFRAVVCSQNRISPLERAKMLQKHYKLNSLSVVIGHSFGGLTAMKWVELTAKPIAGLVLVDASVKSVFTKPQPKYLKELSSVERRKEDESDKLYLYSWTWKVDYKKIRKFVSRITVLAERKTAATFIGWKMGQEQYARRLGGKLVWATGIVRHFLATREPEVLKAVERTMKIVK